MASGGRRETPTRSPAAAAAAEGATEMNTAVMHPSCQFSQKDKNMYYILTDNHPYGSKLFPAGSICYLKEETFLRYLRMEFTRFWRFVMEDDGSVVTMDVENLLPLDDKVAAFLLAVSSARERLSSVLDSHLLDAAMKARVGQHILVELNHQTFPGVLHYIGKLHKSPLPSGIFPVYFGVELESHGEGKGHCDGSYNGTEYFKCKPDCGIFLPFNKLQFLPVPENTKLEETEKLDGVEVMPVKVGDALGFYLDDALTRGIAMDVYKEGSTWMVKVCPEEDGAMDDFRIIPMDSVVKEELLSAAVELEADVGPQEQMKHKRNESAAEKGAKPSSLDVNSVVEINLEKGNSVTGTIRWIGCLPDTLEKVAGVELDEEKGFSDGEVQGVRYFTCPPKRGLFVRLESCQPDMRFQTDCHTRWEPSETSGLDTPAVTSNLPPLRDETAVKVLSGRMRGIQGHCNSCYMDAALFSLFSCTSVLDSMLYKPPFPPEAHVQRILRDKIVNPLRQNGFVPARSVMDLRYHLTEKGQCSSFATSEKGPLAECERIVPCSVSGSQGFCHSPRNTEMDHSLWCLYCPPKKTKNVAHLPRYPEEFLNLIMHHIFGIEPLLKLQSGRLKEQECYCYQIFMDKQEDLVVPNVQQLVEHSFLSSDLKLVEIPSCFILQMPRFGKEYKMFSKIIPSLELDITDLLLDSPRECFVCGAAATQECSACFKDKMFADTGLKQYCDSCCSQAHSHYQRKGHQTTRLHLPEEFHRSFHLGHGRVPREKLELFAVLCIETSHYVTFVKYGPEKGNWMFFDSMADRHGDENGYNIPTVTLCPEVAKYLEMPVASLAMERPREMEGVAKRLFCDAYMYMYQSKRMALYK